MPRPRIAGNTLIVFGANVFSMLFGYGASALVASEYGSGPEVDAFFIALPLPMISGYFILSIALVALVPHYQRIREEHGLREAQKEISPLFWAAGVVSLMAACILFFAADSVAVAIAPGFDDGRSQLLAGYLRLTSLALPFLALSAFLQALENANNLFLRAAFARPLASGMALGALALFLAKGGLHHYFWGLALGAALAFVWQLGEAHSLGRLPISLRGLARVWRAVRDSVGWVALARALGHIAEISLQMIASLALAGVVAVYGFGFKIAAIPLLLAISLSMVLFPAQTLASAKRNRKDVNDLLWKGVNSLAILGALFGSFFYVWADQLVILLYERGDFDPSLTTSVSGVIEVFSLGLVAVAANNTIANAFWAEGRLKERITLEVVAISLLLIGALALIHNYGAQGLAIAYVAQYGFLFVIGLWRLAPSPSELARRLIPLLKIGLVALCLAGAAHYLTPGPAEFRALGAPLRLALVAFAGLGYAVAFFLFTLLARVSEARQILARLQDMALVPFGRNAAPPEMYRPASSETRSVSASDKP
ncbi:MAG: murein biosynthesis integral membrane protein MurJ [Candidatus Zixiibacteriota bacterium]